MESELNELSYRERFRGYFASALRWPQFDELMERLQSRCAEGWYVYSVGEPVPAEPLSELEFCHFLEEISELLRKEHQEDYCGIVYADSLDVPTMVKFYDPNNLGVSCGFSDNPPLPGWVISLQKPEVLESAVKPAKNRSRWWQRLFE